MWYFIVGGILGLIVWVGLVIYTVFFEDKDNDLKEEDVLGALGVGFLIGILVALSWPIALVLVGGAFGVESLVKSVNAKRKARRDGVVVVKPAEKAGVVGFFKGEK